MASLQFSALFLCLSLFFSSFLISPSHAQQTCTTRRFTNNRVFTNCTDLPFHNAFLHWTFAPFNSSHSSLSIAYIAPPATPDGWVAWGINPIGTGMVGTQALIALKDSSSGSFEVDKYSINSYSSLVETDRLSFNVSDESVEFSSNLVTIFAKITLLANTVRVNQVWQVGGSVSADGNPNKHDTQRANLNSFGVLELVAGGQTNGTAPAAAPGSPAAAPGTPPAAPSPGSPPPPPTSGGTPPSAAWTIRETNIGFSILFILIASFVFRF